MAAVPTVTIKELSDGISDKTIKPETKLVLEAILNDYMDLQYGKETPYTTGKQVVPTGATIDDVDNGISEECMEKKYKDLLSTISEVEKSGDLTPRSRNDGTWDPKLTPVLVLVRPNP